MVRLVLWVYPLRARYVRERRMGEGKDDTSQYHKIHFVVEKRERGALLDVRKRIEREI